MIEMLANYEKDHGFIIDRMNEFAFKLNKLHGYTSDEIAKLDAKRSIQQPSQDNEKIMKELGVYQDIQESYETTTSTRSEPPKESST